MTGFSWAQYGYFLVTTHCIALVAGDLLTGVTTTTATKQHRRPFSVRERTITLHGLLSVGAPTAGVGLVASILVVGPSGLGAAALMDTAAELTRLRYQGSRPSEWMSLMLAANYLLVLIGGWLAPTLTKRDSYKRLFVAFPLISLLAFSIISTARAPFLIGTILFGCAFVSKTLEQAVMHPQRNRFKATFGTAKLAIISIVVGTTVFFGAGLVRLGVGTDFQLGIEVLLGKLDSYFMSVGGLSLWYGNQSNFPLSFGAFTFSGVADVLGLRDREVGLTQEYFYSPDGSRSNLYTAFRWLATDFSVFGSHLVLVIYGFIGKVMWIRLEQGDRSAAAAYALFLASIAWSPIVSIFTYNSILLAGTLFVFLVAKLPSENGERIASGRFRLR